ncbi:MAG: amino acid adenylation domain-containing protein, partial [bacterium]|nr:amino acid adenylation domain-containing protein [bacterium]
AHGIGREDVVAVYGHRSAALAWAVVGVLKAGAAFLILDPESPVPRLVACLRRAAPRGWLQPAAAGTPPPELAAAVAETAGCRLTLPAIAAADAVPELREGLSVDPAVPVGSDSLAYVAFTSGSTGTPKGILGRHGSLSHFIPWQRERFDLRPSDRFCMLSGLAHDPLQRDLFTPLQLGARLSVPDPEVIAEPRRLAAWMRDERITVAHLTPAMGQLLSSALAEDPILRLPALRWALFVGDRLTRRDVARLRELAPGVRCVNLYGATETQRAVGCYYPVAAGPDEPAKETIPLGRGIAHVELLVLSRRGDRAGIGELGEVTVRSPHLALGYLGDPRATAARFTPCALSRREGERVYRTGDLGRYLPDGNVEYAGRADRQIKIRGFRIEPGEIEAVLGELPAVAEAVVDVRDFSPNDPRLVAYLVPRPGDPARAELRPGKLRPFLRERLPEYMVPAAFVLLESLPLTPNRKLDRAALPAPELEGGGPEAPFAAPRNPVEELLTELWGELLRVTRVGRDDNFFDLGGHSLLATQLASRLRRVFGVELPLRTLFAAPTVAALAARVETARRAQRGIQAPPLEATAIAGDPPASFAQERLWLLDRLEPDSTAYHLPAAIRWRGPLRRPALERALSAVVERHAVLRTRFDQRDGKVVQVISPRPPLGLPLVDLGALPPAAGEAAARRLALAQARRPFDLARGPLLRVVLLRLAAEDHLVLINQHHIATDGWSIGIFIRETAILYQALSSGEPATLPPLPIQYADFARWQREWLRGEILEAELEYWRQRLAGIPALLELPTDRPRPAVLDPAGGRLRKALSGSLTEGLERLSRGREATLYMTLLAGFNALLHRTTGEEDLLVGSPVANRNHEETEGLVGFFVNTLVLRTDVSGHLGFDQLVERVQQVALQAYEHQDLPFEKLVEELRPERSLAHSPIFQVMFVLQNMPFEGIELPGLMLAPEAVEVGREQFDLTVLVRQSGDGLLATWSYRCDLFDDTTVARMAGHWERLLTAAVADPERSIAELPLLSPGEQGQLLVQWNDTAPPALPPEATLHGRFAAQVRRTPQRLALVCGDEQLSYAELDRRSNALAVHLHRLGVGPETRVGICLGRSKLIPIAMLAVFKAGGTLLPLDPEYPPQRLRLVLEDGMPRVLLTEDHRAEWLEELSEGRAELVRLDREWPQIAAVDAPPPAVRAVADNVLYVVYTSGSTGRPKGIEIPHRVMLNLFDWHLSALLAGARVLQFAHLGFDLSYYEMFSAWLSGGTAYLVSAEVRQDAGELARYLAAARIEKVVLPVVVLHQLAEEYAAGRPLPDALREFTSTAEQLVVTPAVRELFHRLSSCRLTNQYGPSECHVVTCHALPAGPDAWPARPPIGRPIGGARIYLADGCCQPVPVGVPGEVLIGGPCVARGYRDRPGQTAERFVPDPWGGVAGERLYRTGDLARRLPGGELEFLGRIDFQVKVRGFRVELGEIEEVLGEVPGIGRWVVATHEGAGGQTELVGYVVPEGETPPAAGELRAFLAERLPEHMVPAAWVFLDTLPIDANGKVNRRALPAPERPESAADYVPPRNPTEELVAEIWRELLELEDRRVGVHDNFFELGGHSLLATRVVSRLRQPFGIELAVRTLFEAPTVAELGERIAAARRAGAPAAPPLTASAQPGDAPASFAQERLWFIDRLQPGSAAYHLPAAFRWRGPLDYPALAAAVTGVWRRHGALRTRFARRDGRLVQVVAPPQAPPPTAAALPRIDLQGLGHPAAWTEAQRLAREQAVRPFDLTRGPLLRTALLGLGPADHVLLVTQHHVVSDGWSLGIFVREMTALYGAAAGASRSLPPLAVQYGDFSRWQREWLRGEVLEGVLAHWRRRLDGAPELLDLPTDRPRPAVLTTAGGRCRRVLDAPLTAGLEELGPACDATLFMILLSAFKTLLYRYSGQPDLVVGTPIAGRTRPEVEGLIGFFVNTLVLRTDLIGEPSFRDLLARVREVALEAYEHQDLPFEKLVEELRPQRNLSHSPLFQVMFALQNMPGERLAVANVELEPVAAGTGQAQFDLTLSVGPAGDRLIANWSYRRGLFDDVTVARMAGHYEQLLAAVAADPGGSIAALPLVSSGERAQLLLEWNDTAAAAPPETTIEHLFTAQAQRTPQRIALVWGGPGQPEERWSYAELERRAAALAAHLRRLGVGPEVRVAVLMERSPELVQALMAVLKAGGAYVPVDPTYPRQRIEFMLDDSAASVVLTQARLAGTPAFPESVRVVTVDRDGQAIAAAGEVPPVRPAPVHPGNLAYQIYTSGSTGRPKGVAIEHRSAVALLDWLREPFPARDLRGTLASTSICFDLSVFELFGPLASGGTVILAENALHLPSLPAAAEVTMINTVPSAMAQLLRLEGGLPPAVRTVNLAGEPLPRALVERIYARKTVERVFNLYGPSEDTTYSTFVRVPRGDQREPTIGRPVDGTRVYLLDRHLQPLPVGIPGRLYLGGAGLARGYHARPALTAERFVPDPLAPEPGARRYDTGDLARFRADGELEFLGRVDRQIKLRGFRIELGEIETALAAQPGVEEAVVTALREDARLVAYVVGKPDAAALRRALRKRLPEHMVPSAFVTLSALPRTPNGKVDWAALPAPAAAGTAAEVSAPPRTGWEERVAEIWCRVLGVGQVGVDDNFFDLGGHSLLLVEVYEQLQAEVDREFPVVRLFQYPTVRTLAAFLDSETETETKTKTKAETAVAPRPAIAADLGAETADVAVVGMALRFPQADDPDQFWHNLREGLESITFFSDQELLAAGVDPERLADPAYVKAAATIDGIELFDAAFFGFSPLEAATIDPQQRIFLEIAGEALERAGYDTLRYPGRVGVFAGSGLNSYAWNHLASNPEVLASLGGFQVMFSNDKDFLTTRVSYKLGLKGPSVAVQTACSTSLVAVHMACRSLLAGECEMALAGGVTVRVPQTTGYLYQEGTINSPDGHCRTFDADADGTVSGSGAGIVLLKRLADALADGDTIHAVVKGSAINNDGPAKVGYTAPSVEGQATVIADALARAGVEPETVSFVECHGTATALGDPIEVAALNQVYGQTAPQGHRCAIGSVKSNFGHLDAAAGVAGLIKAVLALEHRQIPPSLNFREPNPRIGLNGGGPLSVAADLADWPRQNTPRRAAVSSFGLGGTNAHLVLEEAPEAAPAPPGPPAPWQLVVLSARTPGALESASRELAEHLEGHPDVELAEVAYTLQVGRRAFEHRRIAVCRDAADAAQVLAGDDPPRILTAVHQGSDPRPAFMFSGQGSQHVDMGRGLYETEPLFRREVDRCAELFVPRLGVDLRRLMYPKEGESEEAARQLARIRLGQPALYVIEYALARLWMAWGIRPAAMIGHSVGEYVAGCLAGVFSLEDAVRLVARRSSLMEELPAGRMLSVPLPEAEIHPFLDGGLSLAAVNAPSQCVISGPEAAIVALELRLREQGLEPRLLHVSVAGHSALMEQILDPYLEEVREVDLRPPQIPFISNVTGTWITAAEAADPTYWASHLRRTVRFAAGVDELLKDGGRILLEVGPGRALATLARQDRPQATGRAVLHSLRHPQDTQPDPAFLLTTLGRLWLAGAPIDWEAVHGGRPRRRLPLPTYPFERRRGWIEARPRAAEGEPVRRRADVADWFYQPSWKRTPLPAPPNGDAPRRWLVFADRRGLGARLAARLAEGGRRVATAVVGERFESRSDTSFALRPAAVEDYRRLLAALGERDALPERVLHLWSLDSEDDGTPLRERSFYSLLFLAQALEGAGVTDPTAITVAVHGAHEVVGGEPLCPEQATVLGPCRVIPQEYPNLTCRALDLLPPAAGGKEEAWLIERLIAEAAGGRREPLLAYRGRYRWVRHSEPIPAEADTEAIRLRSGGVYLITGGLGRVGLVLAEALAQGAREVKLVLTGRRELLTAGDDERMAHKIHGIRRLEALGAEVLMRSVDVAAPAPMARLLDEIRERFGALNGVIHAAGVVGGEAFVAIGSADRQGCEEQLRPKVAGARVLAELLGDADLDFCMLVSSLSTVLGGLGFATYSAANHFLDAFAQERSRGASFPWMSVAWDAWRFDEPEEGTGPTRSGLGSGVLDLAIRPREGLAAMAHWLALEPSPQMLISTAELEERCKSWGPATRPAAAEAAPTEPATAADEAAAEPSGLGHARPDLQVAYAAPRGAAEMRIAAVWSELLGIAEIGVHDNFFELGGHSVLATQAVARLRRELRTEVPLATFFAQPTVAGLAAALAAEAEEVPEEALVAVVPEATSIPRLPRPGPAPEFPLSFAQQRFWFLDQLEPGNPVYYVPFAIGLRGALRVELFQRALDEMVRRHETLRTTFQAPGVEPVQVIGPPRRQQLPVIDLSALADPSRQRELRRLALVESRLPFNLARDPQLRTTLVRLAATDQVLLLTMHHIASDFWSMGVLMHELAQLYEAFHRGEETPLVALPVQYPDFAVWQRQWFASGVVEEQMSYWRRTLDGAPAVLELPADHPRPLRPSYRGRSLRMELPGATTAALKELGRRRGATLFMTLLAAFSTLLHRLSGQRDVVVGTPAANRTCTELEGLIGLFVNTLVLRTDLAGDPDFPDLLARVQRTVLGAQAHQDLPFEQLVEELQPERHLARSPLFQVLFVLQTAPVRPIRMAELSFRMVESEARSSQLDLSLNVVEQEDGLRALVQYDPDLFEATTVRRMLEQFRQLLAEIAADPDRRLSRLPCLRAAERHQILLEWSDPRPQAVSDDPRRCSIHALFERWAERTPEAVAVSFAGEELSYRELNARADRLAGRLRRLGVGPERVVGLCFERRAEMVVAILGILKAGGAYLPLDPALPPQRRFFMVDDAGIEILITADGLWDERRWEERDYAAASERRLIVLDYDRERRQPVRSSDAGPGTAVSADHPAYVIYTSGSTGRAKGTVITHGNVIRLFAATEPWFDFRPADVWTLFHSYAFDFSVWEIWGALVYGGRLVVVPRELSRSPQAFYELLAREGVTILNQTPAAFRQLVEAEGERVAAGGRLPELALREVIFGGEAVDLVSLAPWFRRHGERRPRLVNMYGITETTV